MTYALCLTRHPGQPARAHLEVARSRSLEMLADLALDSARMSRALDAGRAVLCQVDSDGMYGRLSPGEDREVRHRIRTGEWS